LAALLPYTASLSIPIRLCSGEFRYSVKNGKLKDIRVVADLLTEEYYGIATPKDSPHLDAINKAIATLLSNGTYKQIYQKWFHAEPPQLPDSWHGALGIGHWACIGHG
jgi:hypothetical protein